MARTPASCKLPLSDVLPTLAAHGLAKRDSGAVAGAPGLLTTDSRKVGRGDIFLAYKGVASDGHDHVAKAIAAGAGMLVVEDAAKIPKDATVAWVEVTNGRAAWARLAAKAFGDPQDKLSIIGVTGTNGKTSTAWMVGQLLQTAEVPCMIVGTIGAFIAGEPWPTQHTTPDPDVLYGLFAAALDRKVKVVVMEVSSHAIAQEKVGPIRFAACAFTSFSRDHLDFHGTMEEYFATKWRLFTELARPGAVMAFADGLEPTLRLGSLAGDTVIYGLDAPTKRPDSGAKRAVLLKVAASGFKGTRVTLVDGDAATGEVPYFARHALENFTAAYILAKSVLGRAPDPTAWPRLKPVPGRLEQVASSLGADGPAVVVDYAHTPDALEKTLEVVRPLTPGRLFVVFGCGGDRDKGKRPIMGRIAEERADRVYVTSDNPRSEVPEAILADITAGMSAADRCVVEVDRAKAIERAVLDGRKGDLVVVAGKGHETYQILKSGTIPFDDRDVAAKALTRRGKPT